MCLHIKYCIDNGFYEESIKLGEEAIKKYPEDTKVQKVIEPILGDKYKNRADKYNQEKRSGGLLDNCCCDACTPCCDYCETCDICIDFGGADTGSVISVIFVSVIVKKNKSTYNIKIDF